MGASWGDGRWDGLPTGWGRRTGSVVSEVAVGKSRRQGPIVGTVGPSRRVQPDRPVSVGLVGRALLGLGCLRLWRQRGNEPASKVARSDQTSLIPARDLAVDLIGRRTRVLNRLALACVEATEDYLPLIVRYNAAEAALAIIEGWENTHACPRCGTRIRLHPDGPGTLPHHCQPTDGVA